MKNDNIYKEFIARIVQMCVILLTSIIYSDIIIFSKSILQKCDMGVVN